MAQTEDNELRDLVIEALEKNGSLAKIRALLRANIFLAFEDEYENVKQNISLDNVLKVPEGVLALSIVHEFLESCNLKNTLFVYKSESRQGKDYNYEGKKVLGDKLCFSKQENNKEPILVTLIKNITKVNGNRILNEQNFNVTYDKKHEDCGDYCKDEQNSSYIVHEDSQSSTTNTSQSDNSIDEKNKLHLRLQLDNSDTDTSSDSSRDKSGSEYIVSEHIVVESDKSESKSPKNVPNQNQKDITNNKDNVQYRMKMTGNNSTDSTSYVELKPFSSLDKKMLNTTGLPHVDSLQIQQEQNDVQSTVDSAKSATLSNISSLSVKNDSSKSNSHKNESRGTAKSEEAEYSNDFSISQISNNKCGVDKLKSPHSNKDFKNDLKTATSPIGSPHQDSHSSVSLSDVTDLISEKSSSFDRHTNNDNSIEAKSKMSVKCGSISKERALKSNKSNSDDSGDFSESPIPSLSNLSLDIHSD